MEEKTYVDDIDRSVYDIRDEEKDAYRLEAGLTPAIVEQLSKEKLHRAGLCGGYAAHGDARRHSWRFWRRSHGGRDLPLPRRALVLCVDGGRGYTDFNHHRLG